MAERRERPRCQEDARGTALAGLAVPEPAPTPIPVPTPVRVTLEQGKQETVEQEKMSKFAPNIVTDPLQKTKQGQGKRKNDDRKGEPSSGSKKNKPVEATTSRPSVCDNCRKKHQGTCLYRTGACYTCGKLGHRARECNQRGPQNQNQNGERQLQCLNCGKNHQGTCLQGTGVCYICGKPGHLATECNQRRSQDQNKGQQV